jgi:manganese/zinc/iron transport system permease protein
MNLLELLGDHTFRTVLSGTVSIGVVSGAIGCFAYLRRQSLVGDVVSHSSLLGVMLFFLASYWITGEGSKSLVVLIPGAMLSGIAALSLTRFIVSRTSVRDDSGMGVMLAIFFGTGILLLRWVQKSSPPIPGRSGLQNYLFGMAASMTQGDLVMIAIIGVSSIVVMLLFWKELKVYTFDPLLARSLGFRTSLLDLLLVAILVNGIVIGIQCIGVVLMVAMLVTPAAAARQWTQLLGPMVTLAATIGGLCGFVGSIASAEFSSMPTGPVVILTGVLIFIISLLFSPSRGLVARKWKQSLNRSTVVKRRGESK